jgi:hypothetical protein
MTDALQSIMQTDGSVAAIRKLGLSNDQLIAANRDIYDMPGYRGESIYEVDSVTGDRINTYERVTSLKALATSVLLAMR